MSSSRLWPRSSGANLIAAALLLPTQSLPAMELATNPNISEPVRLDFPTPGSIVQFLGPGCGADQSAVHVYAITPQEKSLTSAFIGAIELPGGDAPSVASAFLANADKDADPELFLIVRTDVRHPGLRTEGDLYSVYVFDMVAKSPLRIVHMESLEGALGVGLDGVLEGRRVSYPYKDARSVREYLKKHGH